MKLNDNIATDFGSLVTLAFMTFADSEDNSVNFDFMEMEKNHEHGESGSKVANLMKRITFLKK